MIDIVELTFNNENCNTLMEVPQNERSIYWYPTSGHVSLLLASIMMPVLQICVMLQYTMAKRFKDEETEKQMRYKAMMMIIIWENQIIF
jgi:heme/copper-type cytochrome/quinol oxidase subunit 2